MRNLSKSKIIAYRQCPKRLWLEIHKPELRDDSASEMVFAIGNKVGDVARSIYDTAGTGRLIDVDEIGWDAAYAETSAWLSSTPAPLFEAAIRIEGALALADVMLPDPGSDGIRWHMIEVKSSTSVKDYHRDDLAVQTYIATTAGIDLASASLAHVDNSFVYPGGGDYRGLLKAVELTDEVSAKAGEVAMPRDESLARPPPPILAAAPRRLNIAMPAEDRRDQRRPMAIPPARPTPPTGMPVGVCPEALTPARSRAAAAAPNSATPRDALLAVKPLTPPAP